MSRILIVDDEKDIAELIDDVLIDEGFETVIKNNGEEAFEEIKNNKFDLILLDIMMPKMNGIELCSKIRNITSCPIIFLTAKNTSFDKVIGFEIGADDYITKPFIIEELVARVKAHIRRDNRSIKEEKIYEIGQIKINTETMETYKDNKKIELSTREFELLTYLMKNAGIVLSKEQIFESVWGSTYGDIGVVAVNIKSLRIKLDNEEKYIKTVWGLGYKFVKVLE
ncbi:MAG: response regulator transcription factor [Bacilli bacterium]|nr:response regulator transcription factor [Bacilli bacterium]